MRSIELASTAYSPSTDTAGSPERHKRYVAVKVSTTPTPRPRARRPMVFAIVSVAMWSASSTAWRSANGS